MADAILTALERQVVRSLIEMGLKTLQRMLDNSKSGNLRDALQKDVDAAKAVLEKFK